MAGASLLLIHCEHFLSEDVPCVDQFASFRDKTPYGNCSYKLLFTNLAVSKSDDFLSMSAKLNQQRVGHLNASMELIGKICSSPSRDGSQRYLKSDADILLLIAG